MYWERLDDEAKKLIGGRIVDASWVEIVIEKDGRLYKVYPMCHASSCWDEDYEEVVVECSYDEWLEIEEAEPAQPAPSLAREMLGGNNNI